MGGGASSLRLSDTRVFLLQICSCLKMIYGCRAGKKKKPCVDDRLAFQHSENAPNIEKDTKPSSAAPVMTIGV